MKTGFKSLLRSPLVLACSLLLFAGSAGAQTITVSPTTVFEGDTVTFGFTGGTVTGWTATLFDGVISTVVTGVDPTLVVTAPTLADGATSGSIHVVAAYTNGVITGTATLEVEVLEKIPPDVTEAEPSVSTLWPPNHKMIKVEILGVVSEMEDPDLAITITGVMQDEATNAPGSGNTPTDAIINDDGTVLLRAERSGKGNGRVYTIFFTATDIGGSSNGMVSVSVPHSKKGTAIDDGGLFDSALVPAPPAKKPKKH